MNLFCQVEGHLVRQVVIDAESVTLGFDAYSLVIYNSYHFTSWEAIGRIPASTVTHVYCEDTEISFSFSEGCVLIVQLDDKSYRGPEALVLYDEKGGPLAIWN
jgi:hypothetical protein